MNLSVKTFWDKHQHLLIALTFSIWGLYLRYKKLAQRDLWIDELSQISNARGPLKPFWQRLNYGEVTCFPGDYLLTQPFVNMTPDNNKWIIMIPHIIATLLGFWLLYLLCRRYMKTCWGTLITFAVFANNANLVFHAFELRPYAVLATLGLAAFYFTEMIVSGAYRLSGLQKFLIGMLFFLTIEYHAYGIVIVFFSAIFFILKESQRRSIPNIIQGIFKFYALLCLFALPVWAWYATGYPEFTPEQNRMRSIGTFDFIPNPLVNAIGFLKGVFGNLVGYKKFYPLLAGMVAAFIIPHKQRWVQIGFFLIMTVVPIQLICMADVAKEYWFLQRQFIWIISLFAFFLGWCWDAVCERIKAALIEKRIWRSARL